MRRGLLAVAITLALPLAASAASFPTCTISTPPGTVQPNSRVTLLWFTQDATWATISSVGQIPSSLLPQGHMDVYPGGTTIYTMTVGNSLGSRTCSVIVSISSPSYITTVNNAYSSASALSVARAIVSTPIYYTTNSYSYTPSYSYSTYSTSLPWTDNYNNTYYPYGSYDNSVLYDAADPSWDPYYDSPYYSYSPYTPPPTPYHDSAGYFIDNFFGSDSNNSYNNPYSNSYSDSYNDYSDPYQNDNYWNNGQPQYYPDNGTGGYSGYGDPNSANLGGWWDNAAPSTYDPGWSDGNYYYNQETQQPSFQYDTPYNTPQLDTGYDTYNSNWI